MNLRSLRTLVEIDTVGSFAAVAERLGMTLSAVSVQMKTLEQELQLHLFDRTQRPPAMTPIARQVAQRARCVLAEVEALRAIADEAGVLQGVYRLGFVPTASVRLMPECLANAARTQPAARFVVESGLSVELLNKVRAGALDGAIITKTPGLTHDMHVEHLRTEAFALAAPGACAGWSLKRCATRLTHVQFTPTTGIGLLVADHFAARGLQPRARLVLDSVEAVMGCVNAGVGFALLPEPDARRYAMDAAVTPLPVDELHRQLVLVLKADRAIIKQAKTLAGLFAGSG
jgi:DNA-binding transcriptional LysR family regulator